MDCRLWTVDYILLTFFNTLPCNELYRDAVKLVYYLTKYLGRKLDDNQTERVLPG